MCNGKEKPCWLKVIFWWSVVITAIVAAVSLIAKIENARIEREEDEKDSDIKECGC